VSQTPWGGYGLYMEIYLLAFSVLSVTTYVLLKPTFYDIKLAYLITQAATSETMYHLNRLHPNDEDIFIDKFLAWLKTITDFKC
jgi:predicted metal-dependent hydrolase